MQNILSRRSDNVLYFATPKCTVKIISWTWLFQHSFSLSKIILWTTEQLLKGFSPVKSFDPLKYRRIIVDRVKNPKTHLCQQWLQEAGGFKLPDPHILQRACWIAMKEICSLKIFCSEFWWWIFFRKRDTYLCLWKYSIFQV